MLKCENPLQHFIRYPSSCSGFWQHLFFRPQIAVFFFGCNFYSVILFPFFPTSLLMYLCYHCVSSRFSRIWGPHPCDMGRNWPATVDSSYWTATLVFVLLKIKVRKIIWKKFNIFSRENFSFATTDQILIIEAGVGISFQLLPLPGRFKEKGFAFCFW